METENGYPVFAEEDRALFQIEDARSRADSMKAALIPKLEKLVARALDLIRDTYDLEPLDLSDVTRRPAHRKNAAKTQLFAESHVGLTPKLHEGHFSYLRLKITVDEHGMQTVLEANRPHEASKLFDLLNKHLDLAVGLLERQYCIIWSGEVDVSNEDHPNAIRTMKIDPRKQWWNTGIAGIPHDYPIDDEDRLFDHVDDFVALFSVYQAVTEILSGNEERFEQHLQRLNDWNASFEEGDATGSKGESSIPRAPVTGPATLMNKDDDPDRGIMTLVSEDASPPQRREVTNLRIIRDTAIAERVKRAYDYGCQVCGLRLETGDGPYAEGAHIRPLGSPHDGPDSEDNVLCLCPNHHVLFDRGGFTIAEDLSLIGIEGRLRTVEGRSPSATHLAYHRGRYNAAR